MEKSKKNEDLKEKKVKSGFYLIAGIIVGLIVVYVVASLIFGNINSWVSSFDTFQYGPLTFTKDSQQGSPLYHAAYLFTDHNRNFRYNLYLIEDPRKNTVPVEGDLVFDGSRKVYFSLNTSSLLNCSGILRDVSLLPNFLLNNVFEVEHGFADKNEAQANNLSYLTCESLPNQKVISIEPGNQTRIVREGNCYRVEVANCDLLSAAEKFEVQAITDTVKYKGTLANGLY